MLLITGMLATFSLSAQEEQRVFYTFDASNGLADNSAQTLKCTKTGRIVITTIGHVLNRRMLSPCQSIMDTITSISTVITICG